MSSCATGSALDVAAFLYDQARSADVYIQPSRLHRLLYFAQGSYGASHYGRKLMPATFLLDGNGLFEPNVRRVFEYGRPELGTLLIPKEVERFLIDHWRRYCYRDNQWLDSHIVSHEPVMIAMAKIAKNPSNHEEIPHDMLVDAFVRMAQKIQPTAKRYRAGEWWSRARDAEHNIDPKGTQEPDIRLANGRTVKKWRPGAMNKTLGS